MIRLCALAVYHRDCVFHCPSKLVKFFTYNSKHKAHHRKIDYFVMFMIFRTSMRKVVLTVFQDNKAAMSFYKSKLG